MTRTRTRTCTHTRTQDNATLPFSKHARMCYALYLVRPVAWALVLCWCTQAPGATINFRDWQWARPELCQTLLAALPSLSHFKLGINAGAVLTDTLLDSVLQLSPHIKALGANSIQLRSNEHAKAVWPWEALTVGALDVSSLLRMPSPAGDKKPYVFVSTISFAGVTKVRCVCLHARACVLD